MRGTIAALLTTAGLLVSIVDVAAGQDVATEPSPAVKYWISFVDKDAGLGKGPAPVEAGFVTERARRRRALRGRPDLVARFDAPVSILYKDELRSLGIDPVVSSRWLNAVSATLTPAQRELVSKLSFVRSVSTVAGSVEMTAPPQPVVVADVSGKSGSSDLEFGPSLTQIQAVNAEPPLSEGYNGTGLMLGFLDAATDTLHPSFIHLRLTDRIVGVRDFTLEAGLPPQTNQLHGLHGLRVSSVAMGYHEQNLVGPCYGAEYILATTEYVPFEQNQEEDFFVAGMEWIERMGADIVNVSLGYSEFDPGQQSYTYEDMDGNTAKTTIVSDWAAGLGVVVINSAGNEGDDSWYHITPPADGDSVIAVGAVYSDGRLAGFSGRGPTYDGRTKPDVSAMGVFNYFAARNGTYSYGNGTSYAAPLVSSVACQVLQANPSLNPIQVRDILRSTASQAATPDNDLGWGIIDAEEAVNAAKALVTSTEPEEDLPASKPSLEVYPNPASDILQIRFGAELGTEMVEVVLHDVLGRQIKSVRRPVNSGFATDFVIEISDLPPGLYMVRATDGDFELVESVVVR
jgi:hypothetical protein